MAYATVTLTGKISLGLDPAVGRAILTPTVNLVSDLDGNQVIYGSITETLDATGAFSIQAPATDDPNLNPQNFGYTLRFELERGTLPPIPEFGLAAAVGTVDLTDIIPDPANPTYVPTLTGPPNQLVVGSVTASAPGSAPVVVITGDAPNQTIDFVLPRGDTGPQGPPNVLSVGTVTTGAAGTPADVDITGASPNQTIDFVIPQGLQGIQGIQGLKGDPGDVSTQQLNDGLATKVSKAGDTMTGRLNLKSYRETRVDAGVIASGATVTVDVSMGTFHVLDGSAGNHTFIFSNYSSGDSFFIRDYMSPVRSITWPAGIMWIGGSAPTVVAGYNVFTFWVDGDTVFGSYVGSVA